jgi:hypothetical protein
MERLGIMEGKLSEFWREQANIFYLRAGNSLKNRVVSGYLRAIRPQS